MKITLDTLQNPVLTKAELSEGLYASIGLSKRESKEIVEAVFDLMSESLVANDDVKVSGFGNFMVRGKAERPGRNPRTGEATLIAARRVVTFHASPKLKEQLL
ncbi:MAG: integration host factor subunit alpha [Cytophagales bacterium]|nr:integration host factor subunit alpha [Cytophagales bacterium]